MPIGTTIQHSNVFLHRLAFSLSIALMCRFVYAVSVCLSSRSGVLCVSVVLHHCRVTGGQQRVEQLELQGDR